MPNARAAASLLSDLAVIISTALAIVSFFTRTGDGNMAVHGAIAFRYFTVDSNLLLSLCCLPGVLAATRGLFSGSFVLSPAAIWCKYVGTTAVGLTCAVVLVFLGPLFGYGPMFQGFNLWLHLINPLLAAVSLVFLDRGRTPPKRAVFWALLPTLAYAAVYLVMVVVLHNWRDFYGFNAGGLWYVSFPATLLTTAGIATLLRRGHSAVNREKQTKKTV